MNKAEIAKLKVELRAAEKGWIASRPVEGVRYDLILDDGKQLFRVQIKYVNCNRGGSVFVHLDKFNGKSQARKLHPYLKTEVDVIIVYIPTIDRLCWLGPDLFDKKSSLTLRYAPSKNNQVSNIRQAADLFW